MGFDIECVIDIHTYPGEYFCPVCRTLVYPNEAFQSQCTHLYCKPCLLHVANGSRACPYDGYLVTEFDSKMLIESDKVLADKIGKVKVHCLYFRSGCTWEGTLSNCITHCALCLFGNSPVICNRCGVQIVHRQVHEHAQFCPGTIGAQHPVGVVPSLTNSGSTTGDINQAPGQSSVLISQSQNVHGASGAPLTVQNPEGHVENNSQSPFTAPIALPTQDQWYHYQQYYAHRQSNQQSGTMQHQFTQQHPQNPVQVQQQSHDYSQPQAHSQAQMLFQIQKQPSPVQKPPQQPPQLQAQAQMQLRQLLQQLPQAEPQLQVPTQGLAHVNAPVQALAQGYQVTMQPLSIPASRPPLQSASQTLAPTQIQSAQQVPLSWQVDLGAQQSAQYQQAHLQMQQAFAAQAHLQPHQSHPESANQYVQLLSQQPQQGHGVPQLHVPTQGLAHANASIQAGAPAAVPLASQLSVPPVTNHHSYQQYQSVQKIQPQQHQVQLYQPSLALNSVQSQVSSQAPPGQPPHDHGSLSQSQLSVLQQSQLTVLPQNHVTGVAYSQQQQLQAHGQQLAQPLQTRSAVQPGQQAVPNQPSRNSFGFQVQQGCNLQQNSMQPHLRPLGASRPVVPSLEMNQKGYPYHAGGSGTLIPSPFASMVLQGAVNQITSNSPVIMQNTPVQGSEYFLKKPLEIGYGVESIEEKVGQNSADVASSVPCKPTIKHEENNSKVKANASESQQVKLHNHNVGPPYRMMVDPSSSKYDLKAHANVVADQEIQHSHGSCERNFEAQLQGKPHPIQRPNLLHVSSSFKQSDRNISSHPGSAVENFDSLSSNRELLSSSAVDPHGIRGRAPDRIEGHFGSQHARACDMTISRDHVMHFGDGAPNHTGDNNLSRMKGKTTSGSSFYGSQDDKEKALSRENVNTLHGEHERSADRASETNDHGEQGLNHNVGKLDSGGLPSHSRLLPNKPSSGIGRAGITRSGHEYDHPDMRQFIHKSPDSTCVSFSSHRFHGPNSYPRFASAFDDINSQEGLRFGEGPRTFNHFSDPSRIPVHDGRLPPLYGHVRRGGMDGPGYPRNFSEHMVPGFLHTRPGTNSSFGQGKPENIMKGHFPGPGAQPGDLSIAGPAGLGVVNGYDHHGEFYSQMSFPSFPPVGGGRSNFHHFRGPTFRKRKPISSGWCRICEVDCETFEGLELHSQRREHQKMAMDMVEKIKLQNKRCSVGYMIHEGAIRGRNAGTHGRKSMH